MMIKRSFSSILHKNICCGYSLESPQRGDSNEHPQHMFYGEMWKIISKSSCNTHLNCFSGVSERLTAVVWSELNSQCVSVSYKTTGHPSSIRSFEINFVQRNWINTINKEFIDSRKITYLRKCVPLTFQKTLSTGMHFIPLRSILCISYHCRNGMTSYCVVIATEEVRL